MAKTINVTKKAEKIKAMIDELTTACKAKPAPVVKKQKKEKVVKEKIDLTTLSTLELSKMQKKISDILLQKAKENK